jgi:hypothetical protein
LQSINRHQLYLFGADPEILAWLALVIGWVLFWLAILVTVKGSRWRGWSASNAHAPIRTTGEQALAQATQAKALTADEVRRIVANVPGRLRSS